MSSSLEPAPSQLTACQILGLRRDFTPDQLRANFRALALHLHPDKTSLPPQEANALFQRLIKAYNELRHRSDDDAGQRDGAGVVGEAHARQFHELREARAAASVSSSSSASASASGRNSDKQTDERLRATAAASLGGGRSKFDITRFNSVFDQTRVHDVSTDDGYSGWMDKVTTQQIAAKHAIKQGVQAYVEPEPLVSCRGLQYTEIGLGKTRDYGRSSATVGQGHALMFTDYRAAHSTHSRVIDPDTARPRTAFGSVLELESARAAPSEPMSAMEQRARAAHERMLADTDAQRSRTLRRQAVNGQRHQAAVTSALLSLQA